jgi:hypothetical protein
METNNYNGSASIIYLQIPIIENIGHVAQKECTVGTWYLVPVRGYRYVS